MGDFMIRWLVLVNLFVSLGLGADVWAQKTKFLEISTPFLGSALYVPNDGKPHHAIVMLHGSEGGSLPYAQLEAQYWAAHGYVALAYCWYNCGKNPINSAFSVLENVELRGTIKAIEWLKSLPQVKGKKTGLLGWSRGGEQAVLLGSLPDAAKLIDAIAVHTPSDTIVGGFNWGATDKRCWLCSTSDMACFNNSDDLSRWDWGNIRSNPACGPFRNPSTMNAWLLDGNPLKVDSVIEVEKFKKPIFVSVGDKDDMWDYNKSLRIAERLKKSGQPVEIHVFPNERHIFSPTAENIRHELLLKFLETVLN